MNHFHRLPKYRIPQIQRRLKGEFLRKNMRVEENAGLREISYK